MIKRLLVVIAAVAFTSAWWTKDSAFIVFNVGSEALTLGFALFVVGFGSLVSAIMIGLHTC